MKKTISEICAQKEPITCLTSYTTPMATITGQHCDLLLVGDSVAMVLYGHESTQAATMEMMIAHGQAVMRAKPNSVVIVDMPYGSYESSTETALKNAQRIILETGCDGIKLEGGVSQAATIKTLVDHDIPVFGHIGLLPQSVESPEGYKVQGRDENSAKQLMKDAKAVEKAGAFAVVIECVPAPLAGAITAALTIPSIGIGASNACNGQILVAEDMLGITLGKKPKFVKEYSNISNEVNIKTQQYIRDVTSGIFPSDEYSYGAPKTENSELKKAS
ncbi:MAG: 3-methyl-2-oxobutanoate hydroxymethyltransferase [Alphaproteobacteria bacterium]|nr:3-methyl-2-oxobutanoate hydroxymethyltransferase [Alphaproteobacteria bacterium]